MHPVVDAWRTWILELTDADVPDIPPRFHHLPVELQALAAAGEVGKRQLLVGSILFDNPDFAMLDRLLADGRAVIGTEEIPAEPDFDDADDAFGDDPDWDPEHGYDDGE